MRKIVIILILMFIFGCSSVNQDDVLNEYNAAYNFFNSFQSYTGLIKSEFNIDRKLNKDSKDILETTVYLIDGELKKDGSNYNTRYNSSFESMDIKTWYLDGIAYLDNAGYKLSYKDTLQNYFNQTRLYYSLLPMDISIDDIKEIKKATPTSYKFILNEIGSLKLAKQSLFNNLGYNDEVFKLENIESSYTVNIVDDSISRIDIEGIMDGFFVNEYVSIKFNEEINYSNINTTKIEPINNGEEFNMNNIKTINESIYSIKNKEDYVHFLLNKGYSKDDDSMYSLTINDGSRYVYDFSNKEYIYQYQNNSYKYNWNSDIGSSSTCIYDFKSKSIIDGDCDDNTIFYLGVNRNSFMIDVNNSGINDYSVLD